MVKLDTFSFSAEIKLNNGKKFDMSVRRTVKRGHVPIQPPIKQLDTGVK
jgi:hypothetical protein